MAYQKPGVTVRQVQNTASFPLPDPTFETCVVGTGYYWQDIRLDASKASESYTEGAVTLTVDLTQFTEYADIVANTVHAELIGKTNIWGRTFVIPESKLSVAGTTLTITTDVTGVNAATADIKIGFLALNTDITDTFEKISDTNEIKQLISGNTGATWFNPLAFAAEIAISNSGSSVGVIGVANAPGAEVVDNAAAILETKKNVYSIAVLSESDTAINTLATHAVTMSSAENKGERIVIASRDLTGTAPAGAFPSSADRDLYAADISAYSTGKNNKRLVNIHPPVVYVEQNTHVSTLTTDFIDAVYGSGFAAANPPRFANKTTINGKVYTAGTAIQGSVITSLISNANATGNPTITAQVPVPGYFLAAAVAGQISGKQPQQPLTNSSVAGPFVGLIESNEYFGESQLNTIAAGGNWIIEQKGLAFTTRHQLSTAATTVETREISITNQLDFVAKYLRDLVSPTIGINVISPAFLNQLRAAFSSAGDTLQALGIVESLTLLNLEQDQANPDTVTADFNVGLLYPVNFIKITLTF